MLSGTETRGAGITLPQLRSAWGPLRLPASVGRLKSQSFTGHQEGLGEGRKR